MARPLSKFGWLSLVQQQDTRILDAKAKAVAAALVMLADRDAITLAVGVGVLVERTSLSRNSVLRGLEALERDCWINARRCRSHKAQSRKVTNTYAMTVPSWARAAPPTESHTETRSTQTMSHTETRSTQTMSHTETRSTTPERPTMSHTGTPLRGKEQGVEAVRANNQEPEPPIRGRAIRDILEHRTTHPRLHTVTGDAS